MASIIPKLQTETNPRAPFSPPLRSVPLPGTQNQEEEHRDIDDIPRIRKGIYGRVIEAARQMKPLENSRHRLRLTGVNYVDPDTFSRQDWKKAILSGNTLGRRLRGTWVMEDVESGEELDRKTSTLGLVPHLTDLGTYIHNGNQYTLSSQMRLRPGIFSRQKENGEIEAHVNIMPGKGFSHRYFLDPKKGVFYLNLRQAKIPMMPLLRAMGATDKELQQAWGNELFAANYQHDDPGSLQKLYTRVLGDKAAKGMEDKSKRQQIAEAFEQLEVDPEVTKRTLGRETSRVDKQTLLDTTNKLLKIAKGEADVDDRDAMAYQTIYGPEDLFAERIEKDYGRSRMNAFWKASFKGNLKGLPAGLLGKQIDAALLHSGLGNNIEETNPLEILDKQTRISRMGEGGIPSTESIPDEARNLQPTHLGFIDPLRTPESLRVGVDLFLSGRVRKGKDNRLYAPMVDNKTQKVVYKSPQDLADATIGFPGYDNPKKGSLAELFAKIGRVPALVKGKYRYPKKEEVDYFVPHFENTFSKLGNLVPMKSAIKGQRAVMASRMFTQALPLKKPEAPLVQAAVPDEEGVSFEEQLGGAMGAVRSKGPGSVRQVTDDFVEVAYDDGTKQRHELYNNYPFNRRTYAHNRTRVQPGQRVGAGDLLAASNYTDENGTTAIGTNLRVAYLPYKGLNFEDAVVISEAAADKLSSEHMYQEELEWGEDVRNNKRDYIGLYPGKFTKQQLAALDDDGVALPGTKLEYGDPIMLGARKKERAHNRVHRKREPGFMDVTVTWKHQQPGEVTDVVKGKNGPVALTKATMPFQEGDKLAGRYGDKAISAAIVPDAQMPRDANDQPYEVLLNPAGIPTRTNPAQLIEAALGKIAAKTGKPYKVKDFEDIADLRQFAEDELKKHGVSFMEDVFDPETDRKINRPVATGNRFFMKLHHTAEGKLQGRGMGGYTQEGAPAKGGEAGSKRIGILETNALLSAGATQMLRDAGAVRGQRNEDYWLQFMQGHTPAKPRVPLVFEKFVNQLKGAGINVVPQDGQLNIMALTDSDIDELAGGRKITKPDTVSWKKGLKEIPGGLFSPKETGGHNGNKWSMIPLAEPMPSPVMEEPIRRILGLTKKQLEDVIGGKHTIGRLTGPQAVAKALDNINLDKELLVTRAQAKASSRTARDKANRKLQYLKSAKSLGIHPREWVLSKVPVIPPMFRPISVMQDNKLPLVSDPNYLYQELMDFNQNLAEMKKELGDDVGEERLALYKSFKAVTGLGDPLQKKLQEKKVKGILKGIFGSSPKFGAVQRKLLSSTVDNVGRAVIAPDPNLDMDSVGLPEDKAWDVYKVFVARRLKRKGLPLMQALKEVKERTPRARAELAGEMERRPVVVNRAPVLHKFGVMAFWPKLHKGDTLKVSPLVVSGFGADFDGNCCVFDTLITIYVDVSRVRDAGHGEAWLKQLEEVTVRLTGKSATDEHRQLTLPIGEFPRVGSPVVDKHGADVYTVPDGVSICSYDHANSTVAYKPVTYFTVDRNHPCVRVETSRKRVVEVSDNESLAVFDNETGELIKRKPEQSLGCLMPVVKTEPIAGTRFDRETGWWYAVLACDGWVSEKTVGYSKSDTASRQEFERIARTINPAFSVRDYPELKTAAKYADSHKIHLNGTQLVSSLFSVYAGAHRNRTADERGALFKKLPDELLAHGNRDCMLGMLSGLLDGDRTLGWNDSKKSPQAVCKINTSSRWMVSSVQQLGRYLGIRVSVTTTPARGKSRESYTLSLSLIDIAALVAELRPISEKSRKWLSEFRASLPRLDSIDSVPLTKNEAALLADACRAAGEHTLYSIMRRGSQRGFAGRSSVSRALEIATQAGKDDLCRCRQRVESQDIHWDRVKTVIPISSQDVFDLAVADTQVFMAHNGLIIYDTMQYHVPTDEDAVAEAVDRMLPSRSLLSPADFKTPVHGPSQEYVAGLYEATAAKSKRRPRTFATKEDARAAWMRGEIDVDDQVIILHR